MAFFAAQLLGASVVKGGAKTTTERGFDPQSIKFESIVMKRNQIRW
jgi:hypothetical protein